MLSKKTKYGLVALLHLARNSERGPILISELASAERIPKKFLEAILLTLNNNGILQSRKGKGGGYSLAGRPETVTLGRVLTVLEGPLAPVECLSGPAPATCPECRDFKTCGIRLTLKDVYGALKSALDSTTLADILEREERAIKQERGILDFVI